jgi:hypothetical protein
MKIWVGKSNKMNEKKEMIEMMKAKEVSQLQRLRNTTFDQRSLSKLQFSMIRLEM